MDLKSKLIIIFVLIVVVLLVVLAAIAAIVQSMLGIAVSGGQPLELEYDYIQGVEVKVEYSDGRKLGEVVGDGGIELRVLPQDITDLATRANVPCPYYDAQQGKTIHEDTCFSDAEIDDLIVASRGPAPANAWYAHGLLLQCCKGTFGVPPDDHACGSFDGLLWLDHPPGNKVREDFVVFYCNHCAPGFSATVCSDNLTDLTAHELGHVLNAHHCEIFEDGDGDGNADLKTDRRLGPMFVKHLEAHRTSKPSFVEPGPNGVDWCDAAQTALHATEIHTPSGCDPEECASFSEVAAMVRVPRVSLTLVPEKSSYLPGEPARVDAVLAVRGGPPVDYLSEMSLEPALGHLKLWVTDERKPLRAVVLATARLVSEPLTTAVAREGVDVWYGLPPGQSPRHSYSVVATFTGFPGGGRVVVSDPVQIHVEPPTAAPGHPLFEAGSLPPEGRRFIYLLGGDHLTDGMQQLATLWENSGSPTYGAYADLAMGLNLAQAFRRYDPAQEGLVTRPADPAEAVRRIRQALQTGTLSRSYALLGQQALARLLEEQAAGRPPAVALGLYQQAKAELQAIAAFSPGSHRPLSRSERGAVARANAALPRVEQLIVDLGG